MRKRAQRRIALFLATTLPLSFGCTALAQQVSGDAAAGESLFLSYACYSCHGYNGTGRRPLSVETSGILSSEAVFLRYLRLRGDENPVNPKNSMPHYAEASLSDAEALDIYAYLRSLEDNPPALDDIPVMQKILEDAERSNDSEQNP